MAESGGFGASIWRRTSSSQWPVFAVYDALTETLTNVLKNGQVTEKPRATVFQNGVLVQNNEEFTGMTGIQYGQYKDQAATGPLILQGDHDTVLFRNVWIVPE